MEATVNLTEELMILRSDYRISPSQEFNDDTWRYANANQLSPESSHSGDIMQLHNINEVGIPKPQYQTILDGREEQHAGESDVNSEYISASSDEERMAVNGNFQDSNSEDTDTYFTPPSSLNHPTSGPCHPEAFDKEELVLNGTKTEVVEERQEEKDKCDDDDDDEVVEVKDCEEESPKVTCEIGGRSSKITAKTVQDVAEPPPKHAKGKACNSSHPKVCYVSDVWQKHFPLNKMVPVRHGKRCTVHHSNGGCIIITYIKVAQVHHEVLSNWKQLDGISQSDTVIAYLEDENSGYKVKEYFQNGLVEVIDKISGYLKVIKNKLNASKVEKEEVGRLNQLLKDLLISFIDAVECLHQSNCVSMNLHVNNLYVRFNCDCWAIPTCVHGSSGAMVVIGHCESAYPVGSLIDGPNNSKALKLLGPMHKYKRAEVVYDHLDLVFVITELYSKIFGDGNWEQKMNSWASNIADAVFADPPVEELQQLLKELGISQNGSNRITDHLMESAAHYSRACGEHDV